MRRFSNLNLLFIIKKPIIDFPSKIKNLFPDLVIHSITKRKKFYFYLSYKSKIEQRTFKIEIQLLTNLKKLFKILLRSNLQPQDLQSILLLDKEGTLDQILDQTLKKIDNYKNNGKQYILEFINNFIYD